MSEVLRVGLSTEEAAFSRIQHYLDSKKPPRCSKDWRAVEDAYLIAHLLSPLSTWSSSGRTLFQVLGRGWLSTSRKHSLAQLLSLDNPANTLSEECRSRLAARLVAPFQPVVRYVQFATALDEQPPTMLTRKLCSRGEMAACHGAAAQAVDAVADGFGSDRKGALLHVVDSIADAPKDAPLLLAARTRNLWLDDAHGRPLACYRESGSSACTSADFAEEWRQRMDSLPSEEPAIFTSHGGATLHAVALPSALHVLEVGHPVQLWLDRLYESIPPTGTSAEKEAAFLRFVPPLPLDFPTADEAGTRRLFSRGLSLQELFALAEEHQLARFHRGGGEALHIVDYVATHTHAGKACKVGKIAGTAPCPTTTPLGELFGDVATAMIYAFARPAVALLETIIARLWPGYDGTAQFAPSYSPHGGSSCASYLGLKWYFPEHMYERFPGMAREFKSGGNRTFGRFGQYLHTDHCDGTTLGLLLTLGQFDGFEQTLMGYVHQIRCGHFTVLVARFGLLAHLVRAGKGLRLCVLVHLHQAMVPNESVAAVRQHLNRAAANGDVTVGQRELADGFVQTTEAANPGLSDGKKPVAHEALNYATVKAVWQQNWLKPLARGLVEDAMNKGSKGRAVREVWLSVARERHEGRDCTWLGQNLDFERQLLGVLCDPCVLVAMCDDCDGPSWRERLYDCTRRLRAALPSDYELCGVWASKRAGAKRGHEDENSKLCGLRAAVRAIEEAERREFRGFD